MKYVEPEPLTPKYNIGDIVWFNTDNKVDSGYVDAILIQRYVICYEIFGRPEEWKMEKDIFKTKEDLIYHYHGN